LLFVFVLLLLLLLLLLLPRRALLVSGQFHGQLFEPAG